MIVVSKINPFRKINIDFLVRDLLIITKSDDLHSKHITITRQHIIDALNMQGLF